MSVMHAWICSMCFAAPSVLLMHLPLVHRPRPSSEPSLQGFAELGPDNTRKWDNVAHVHMHTRTYEHTSELLPAAADPRE